MSRRTDRARIAELEAANRQLVADAERLRSHLAVAQVIAQELLAERLREGFAKDAAAYSRQLSLQLQVRSLHVYGASTRGPTLGTVTGL